MSIHSRPAAKAECRAIQAQRCHTENTRSAGKKPTETCSLNAACKQQVLSCRRETARRLKSVEILLAAAQLYEKSHLTRRIALSCGIKISPVSSLD